MFGYLLLETVLPFPELGVDVQQRIAASAEGSGSLPSTECVVFTVHRRRVVGLKTEKGMRWQDAPDAVRFKQRSRPGRGGAGRATGGARWSLRTGRGGAGNTNENSSQQD